MKLSKNLTLAEVVRSETAKRIGIDNTPTEKHLDNLKTLAKEIFQPIRDHFKKPIHISSGYRSERLNSSLKGTSTTSQHMTGEAIDIDNDGTSVSNLEIFQFIKNNLDFDTLIWEFGNDESPAWIHVSYRANRPQRGRVLKATKNGYEQL
jgi:zinc D-Ala-D-Ala carboxypeptidase